MISAGRGGAGITGVPGKDSRGGGLGAGDSLLRAGNQTQYVEGEEARQVGWAPRAWSPRLASYLSLPPLTLV